MPRLKKNYSLKSYNTFHIDAKAKYFATFESVIELKEILKSNIYSNNKTLILGGGSNILLTKDYNGLVLHNKINGICIIEDNKEFVKVEVGGGVNWNEFVKWSVSQKLSGIENLALIPGSVGASPVQNIGAYGVEVKDTITNVFGLDIDNKKNKIFSNQMCNFRYRDSIFKTHLKNKIIITKVEFRLSKTALNKTAYGAIEEELKILNLNPSPKNIANAVTNIRNRKLPNTNDLGNTGSFFKNPIITKDKYNKLQKIFPNIIGYKISENEIKLAAGWLIEKAGLKGYRKGDAGVHKNQALVLINYGNASGKEIINLAKQIQEIIFDKFEVRLETEVNIL